MNGESKTNSSVTMLVIAWLIVGMPALWGVSKTVQQSLKLFQTNAAAATQPTTQH